MGASSTDDYSLNRSTTAIASLSGPAKDLNRVLHIPFFSIRLYVCADTGPFPGDALSQYVLNPCMKGHCFELSQTVCTTCWQKTGMEQGFVGIDIANASDFCLI